jgi:hypothetical protein
LHRWLVSLRLEARKRRSVIFEDQEIARHLLKELQVLRRSKST